jgi:hypothetical protein
MAGLWHHQSGELLRPIAPTASSVPALVWPWLAALSLSLVALARVDPLRGRRC